MATISALSYIALTTAINNVKSPNTFLQRLLYPNHQTLGTETIALESIEGARQTAPFVRVGAEAIMVSGTSKSFATIAGPNIRIKMPFTPSPLLFGREPGDNILIGPTESTAPSVERHISRDLAYMGDMVTNSIEYLCSRMLQGQISILQDDQEVIQITLPRSSSHNITLSTFWDSGGANARPLSNIHAVKELLQDEGVQPTDAICGSEAANALLGLAEAGHIKLMGIEGRNVSAGSLSFVTQFNEEGVIFLGELGGVRFWQYSRTVSVAGVSTPMVRAKYVEFVTVSPAADRVLYFAAIPDLDAFEGRVMQTERFSKSWKEKDPSRMMALVHSRPLPWNRRPNTSVSMKVVSG